MVSKTFNIHISVTLTDIEYDAMVYFFCNSEVEKKASNDASNDRIGEQLSSAMQDFIKEYLTHYENALLKIKGV